ncbi:unnamed protein product [Didymodactylos carnosus]|uniref:Uncharacterized protein n=1 Tax=Didymodactylos carnosus TaxID=1234261 RepID=A0A8S2LY64_9BILA|nr:unnamed protein product [Didymodactylos carnosus]CAF3914612.1 unnamed protein product [Didymodactylos carnosus]
MSTYITVLSTIFKYLGECGDHSIVMKMELDGNSLIVTFTAYEKRSLVSRTLGDFLLGTCFEKPWSTYTYSAYVDGSSRVDKTPEKITKFEVITVRFSKSARDGYNRLVDTFFNESDNVDQKKLLGFLAHLCNPNATDLNNQARSQRSCDINLKLNINGTDIMSTYITVLSTIFKYLGECGDHSIVMKMELDGNSLIVTFTAYEKRSLVSRTLGDFLLGTCFEKPWSTYTYSAYVDGSSRVDKTPEKITKFEVITVRFSKSARDGYNRLVDTFFNESDNVDQKKLLGFLAHLCNPNATDLKSLSKGRHHFQVTPNENQMTSTPKRELNVSDEGRSKLKAS